MDQNHEVEGVQFETDSYKALKFYSGTTTPKIIQWVIKYSGGLVKEEKQAHYVLFGFVILAILVSLFLFFGIDNTRPSISPNDLLLTPTSGALPS